MRFKQLVVVDQEYDLHTVEYTYDAISRLLNADYHAGINTAATPFRENAYGYDLAGNLVDMDGVTRTFNAANQLVDDDKGNLTNDGVNAYTWDRANRLLSMGGVSYAYDGLSNRISRDNGVDVTKYLLDLQPGLSVVLSATEDSDVTRYVHSPRGIHAQEDNAGVWTHPLQDGLGNVRSVVDNALSVLWTGNPAPYGEYFSETGTRQSPYLFTGEYTDPITGLVHLRARDYAPGIGVFTALDPFEGVAELPMSVNGYGYISANPINHTDPSGLQATGVLTLDQISFQAQSICGPQPLCFAVVVSALALSYGLSLSLQGIDAAAFQQYQDEIQQARDCSQPPGIRPVYCSAPPIEVTPAAPEAPPVTRPGTETSPDSGPEPGGNGPDYRRLIRRLIDIIATIEGARLLLDFLDSLTCPSQQPQPTPGTPTPTPTQQVCDPNKVRQWLQTNVGIPETTTPGTAYDYQRRYCGLKYEVYGNGRSVVADGIDINTCRLLDAKYIANASESVYVLGSDARQRGESFGMTARVDAQESDLFERYAAVLRAPDSENPFIGLDVITNDLASETYWQLWIDTHGVPNARIREEPWP